MTEIDHNPTTQPAKGFTLLELILTIILIGIAGSIGVVGLSSLSGIGQERKNIVDAQLAQERLELILAEKRNSGFPTSDVGADTDANGPDPCDLYDLTISNFPSCDPNKITVHFLNQSENSTCYQDCTNCTVTVAVDDGPEFQMILYNYFD